VGIAFPPQKGKTYNRIISKLPKNFTSRLQEKPTIEQTVSEILDYEYHKKPLVSAIISDKTDTKMQKKRIEFIKFLKTKNDFPLKVYGRGGDFVLNKFDVLKNSTHHIAIENSSHLGNWTEKIADSLLTLNLSFYQGAPDILSYFSEDSVKLIDLEDFENSNEVIAAEFHDSKPNYQALRFDRNELIEKFSFESTVSRFISHIDGPK